MHVQLYFEINKLQFKKNKQNSEVNESRSGAITSNHKPDEYSYEILPEKLSNN